MCATSAASPRRDCFDASDRQTRSSSSDSAESSFDSSLVLIVCYSMDFFDPQRCRVTYTDASKQFRSLFDEESTPVASSAFSETTTAHALAFLSSRVEKTVKNQMTSMSSFFCRAPTSGLMRSMRLRSQRCYSSTRTRRSPAGFAASSRATTGAQRRGRMLEPPFRLLACAGGMLFILPSVHIYLYAA